MGGMWQSRDDHDEDDDDAARVSGVRGSSERVVRKRLRLWLHCCTCSLDDNVDVDVDVGRSFSRWAAARLLNDDGGVVVVASACIST
jgi:hypothetical protein